MTPTEQLDILREQWLNDITTFFTNNRMTAIEFEPVENDLGIEPLYLDNEFKLTLVDEFGNEYDEKLNTLPVETVAVILTLIQSNNFWEA